MHGDSDSIAGNQGAIDGWKIERALKSLLYGLGNLDQAACDCTAKLNEIEG